MRLSKNVTYCELVIAAEGSEAVKPIAVIIVEGIYLSICLSQSLSGSARLAWLYNYECVLLNFPFQDNSLAVQSSG